MEGRRKITAADIAKFGMLGALLYLQKVILSGIPNVHLTAVLLAAFTVVYRVKALYPLYLYVILEGLFGGFTVWWVPYLYVWTILWGAVMLLPEKLPDRKYGFIIYMLICGLHGLLFGMMCAPVQALLTGMDFQGMTAWIVAGLPFDAAQGISNFCLGVLAVPVIRLLRRLERGLRNNAL